MQIGMGVFFSEFLLNIRSLSNKIRDLNATIETLNCSPDIIALTESWLTENDPIPFLSGYQNHSFRIVAVEVAGYVSL